MKPLAHMLAMILGAALSVDTLWAQPDPRESFHQNDIRVFKSVACTKDNGPVEALYYIAASRADMAAVQAAPSAQLMKAEVDKNWRTIASRLTSEQVMEERFAKLYHTVLSEHVPLLEEAVKKQSGVSISVSEVNSRPIDPSKDKDAPSCHH